MKLIIIYGPPGVGKLAVAQKLAEVTELKLLHNHMTADLAVPIFGLRTPASIEFAAAVRMVIYETAARHNLFGIISTVIYYPGVQAHKFFIDSAELMAKYEAEVFVIGLTASFEALKQRVTGKSRQGTRKIVSPEKLEQVIADENLMATVPEDVIKNLVIDTTNLKPEAVVEKIKVYCEI